MNTKLGCNSIEDEILLRELRLARACGGIHKHNKPGKRRKVRAVIRVESAKLGRILNRKQALETKR